MCCFGDLCNGADFRTDDEDKDGGGDVVGAVVDAAAAVAAVDGGGGDDDGDGGGDVDRGQKRRAQSGAVLSCLNLDGLRSSAPKSTTSTGEEKSIDSAIEKFFQSHGTGKKKNNSRRSNPICVCRICSDLSIGVMI